MAVPTGIEPALFDVTDRCFNQLNYGTIFIFVFSYIYIITYFFIKIKKDFQGSCLFGSDVYTISPLSQIVAGEVGIAPTSFAASDFGSFNSC